MDKTRLFFKTLGISGILVGCYWAHSANVVHDSFELVLAGILITTSIGTILFIDGEL